jgi:CRP-like cAMP-binding protein
MTGTGQARKPDATPTLLTGIPERDVNSILEAATPTKLLPNRMILTGGEQATHVFMLKTGIVKYYRLTHTGDEVLFGWLVPGNVFGLASLLSSPVAYLGSAMAITECQLYVWERDRMRKLAQTYPQLAENSFRVVLKYLTALADRHAGLISLSAEQRLADALLELGRRTGQVHSAGVEVEITNEQLGDLAHTTSFTASRLLSRWKRAGALSKKRGKVIIHTPESLVSD